MHATVCWGSIRNRDCILYPGAGTVVLIRPAQTFYERINIVQHSKRDSARHVPGMSRQEFSGSKQLRAGSAAYSADVKDSLIGVLEFPQYLIAAS